MSSQGKQQFQFAWAIAYCLGTSFLYYVTLVQFGLLHHFTDELALPEQQMFTALGAMAFCGIASAIAAGVFIDNKKPSPQWLMAAIGSCSIIAFGLAFLCFQPKAAAGVTIAMAALGTLLGTMIVLLLYTFNRYLHLRIRGVFAGFAAAGCYMGANLIAAYAPTPQAIGTVNAILIGSNVLVVIWKWETISEAQLQPFTENPPGRGKFALALLPIFLLVLLDTYSFYPIGQPGFNETAIFPLFTDDNRWLTNGIWHFLFAVTLGMFSFSLGNRKMLIGAYMVSALTAGALIGNHHTELYKVVFPLYGLLVALYTIALFTVWGGLMSEKSAALRIGLGMALCGWIGSGAGIGISMEVLKSGVLEFPYFFVPAIIAAPFGVILLLKKKLFNDYVDLVSQKQDGD